MKRFKREEELPCILPKYNPLSEALSHTTPNAQVKCSNVEMQIGNNAKMNVGIEVVNNDQGECRLREK